MSECSPPFVHGTRRFGGLDWTIFLFMGPPVRFHVDWWEGNTPHVFRSADDVHAEGCVLTKAYAPDTQHKDRTKIGRA